MQLALAMELDLKKKNKNKNQNLTSWSLLDRVLAVESFYVRKIAENPKWKITNTAYPSQVLF